MGKLLDSLESPHKITYGPAADAIADALRDTVRSIQFGVACAGGCALLTHDLASSGWAGLGGFCFLLGVSSFADVAGPTLGQIGAEWQYNLEGRRGRIVDDEPDPPRGPHIIQVREWALDGEGANGEPNVKQARFYSLSLTPRQGKELAAFVESGKGFSEAKVTRACPSIGSKRWDKLKNELLANGLIRFKRQEAPTLGVEPTNKLRALARVILHSPIE